MAMYYEKIARINLTTGKISVQELDPALARSFIGGRGLGAKLLYDEGCAAADPLSAENKLIFITGPLTASTSPSSGRYMIVTKSPLSGMLACANSGGIWGSKLKGAGFDVLLVEGQAPEWTYLNITDGKIELLDASEYCGLDVDVVYDKLIEKHGPNASVLNIGPAGENLVLNAVVANDRDRASGRGGVGAVLGSKKLKAIVVSTTRMGLKDIAVDYPAFREANKACLARIRVKKREEQATAGDNSSYPAARSGPCVRCPISCHHLESIANTPVGSPKAESLRDYKTRCGIDDHEIICACHKLCNQLGLDTISVPMALGAAMDLYQAGYIKEEECDGIPLVPGSGETMFAWIRRMAQPTSMLARLMSEGADRLCKHYGCLEMARGGKKNFDKKSSEKSGDKSNKNTGSKPGDLHLKGHLIDPEVLGLPDPPDLTTMEGRAECAKIFQNLSSMIDSMGTCLFTSFALGIPEYTALLNAIIGTGYTTEDFLLIADRIYNMERMFNKAAGMKPEDDRLPKRLLIPLRSADGAESQITRLDLTLEDYYKARGWENAFPTKETLEKLDL